MFKNTGFIANDLSPLYSINHGSQAVSTSIPSSNLVNVTGGDVPPIYNPSRLIKVPGCFENFSSLYVPPAVEAVLSFGIRFCPPWSPSIERYIKYRGRVHELYVTSFEDPVRDLKGYYMSFITLSRTRWSPRSSRSVY